MFFFKVDANKGFIILLNMWEFSLELLQILSQKTKTTMTICSNSSKSSPKQRVNNFKRPLPFELNT